MTISIARGRQFLSGDTSAQLFDAKGKAGTYLSKAGEKLASQQVSVQLEGPGGQVKLATAADWTKFVADHASTKAKTDAFAASFGISFGDFVNAVDDAAASDAKALTLDLRPTSELAKALSLDSVDGDYATKAAAGAKVNLTGDDGTTITTAEAKGSATIGPEILNTPIGSDWERDRTEQEAWADFKVKDGSNRIFRSTNASEVFTKLHKPKWDDPDAMALVDAFTMPMHLEISETKPDGTAVFQDKDEMFRETYFDDRNGALGKAGASVRARVRFDDKEPYPVRRVLIQAKEGREVTGESSAVHKFEKRFEGTWSADEMKAQELLKTGKDTDGTSPLKVAQMLYKLAKDKGTLPDDGNLRLEPKHIVLQKRRRSHMVFENVSAVKATRADVQKEIDTRTAANQPVPEALTKYAAKLDQQIAFLDEASTLLSKHGNYMPANTDGFIISADRYSVYDPSARKDQPNDIDDEAGRVGRGLHLEAEWDTASSDPFEKAMKSISEKLAATPPPANKDELEADLAKLKDMSATIRKDVSTAVELMKQKMTGAGLELDDKKASKEERASEFMADTKRPVFWL